MLSVELHSKLNHSSYFCNALSNIRRMSAPNLVVVGMLSVFLSIKRQTATADGAEGYYVISITYLVSIFHVSIYFICAAHN